MKTYIRLQIKSPSGVVGKREHLRNYRSLDSYINWGTRLHKTPYLNKFFFLRQYRVKVFSISLVSLELDLVSNIYLINSKFNQKGISTTFSENEKFVVLYLVSPFIIEDCESLRVFGRQ